MDINNLEKIESGQNAFSDRLLRLALDVGEGMLKNGGEIHRVEESIRRICLAYGAAHVEVFAITSLIVASVRLKNGEYSLQMRRVYSSSNNMRWVEGLNAISRRVCVEVPSLDEFEEMIRDVKRKSKPSFWLQIIAGILVAGGFSIMFGGSLLDAAVASFMGVVVVLLNHLQIKNLDSHVRCVFISFVCGMLTCIAVHFGIGHNENIIMIGTIMLLIPGLALGSSLQDMVYGDILAGSTRLIQACLTAVMIAVGFGLAIFISGVLL